MSDCSTEAMKPKDMEMLNCPDVSETCETIEGCPCESCGNNLGYLAVKTTYEKKEQRHQQLLSVAYDLFVEFLYYSRNIEEIEAYRERLAALEGERG